MIRLPLSVRAIQLMTLIKIGSMAAHSISYLVLKKKENLKI